MCFRSPHLQLAQLSDKLDILAVSVSCSLQIKFGVFRTIGFGEVRVFVLLAALQIRHLKFSEFSLCVHLYSAHALEAYHGELT